MRQLSEGRVAGVVAALLAAVMPSMGRGADDAPPMFSIGGFGTVGMVHSTEHEADFTSSILKPNGAGFSHNWSSDVDSRFAVQVSADLTSRLSGMVQVISEQNYDDTYRPHVEWASIKYQFTPDFSLRVGRTVFPSFLVSDTRKLEYAHAWVRPPLEIYGLVPVSSSDGIGASYTLHIGDVLQTFVASYGKNRLNLPNVGPADARRNWVIADTLEYGATTVHIAYQEAHFTVDKIGLLFDGFRQFGAQGNALADRYDQQNKRLQFFGLGALYDPGRWFVTGEWGTSNFHSVLGHNTAWYVSGGYRVAKFTPYVTYARANSDNLSDPGLMVSALPPYLAGPATGLNAALNSILSSKVVESTVSAGVRWDFKRNFDCKLQFDRTRIGAGSTGLLVNHQADFRLGSQFNLISVTVDFVF